MDWEMCDLRSLTPLEGSAVVSQGGLLLGAALVVVQRLLGQDLVGGLLDVLQANCL